MAGINWQVNSNNLQESQSADFAKKYFNKHNHRKTEISFNPESISLILTNASISENNLPDEADMVEETSV